MLVVRRPWKCDNAAAVGEEKQATKAGACGSLPLGLPQCQGFPEMAALLYGRVEKTREGKRVTNVEKKLVTGPPSTDLSFVSTSPLERQNGTPRSRNRYLVRKTYGFAKLVTYMDDQCEVDKTFYNFCRQHRGLKGETPAMR